jgi:hypothetical protein
MHPHRSPPAQREPFLDELATGFGEVRSRRWVWKTILISSLFLALYVAPLEVVGPIASRDRLGGATAWGLINASFAAGMALGGLLVASSRLGRPMLFAGCLFLVTSCSPLLLALPAAVAAICFAYVLEGIGVGVFISTWETALQRQIPQTVLSRVSAWDWMGSLAGMPLGYALAGPLIAFAGISGSLVALACSAFVLNLFLLASADVRRLGETVPLPAAT